MASSRRTRIVCTLGPATSSPEQIEQLIRQGMDVARLNLSHGDHASHRLRLELVRRIAQELGCTVAVLLDLQGPKIRVGDMRGGSQLLATGSLVRLSSDQVEGSTEQIPIDYKFLTQDVRIGNTVLLDDGLLELRIEQTAPEIIARVVHGGDLHSRKGVNLPDVRSSLSALTDKDVADLKFGLSLGVDFIALSFVRYAEDVRTLQRLIHREGGNAAVIAKIEKPEALNEIDGIIEAADGIMIARGDLGIEIASEQVPLVQKQIIEKCLHAGKPVITATQMLESMITNARPTRAESSDVANAVLDGTDAVMLSAETAIGRFPAAAVSAMDRICRSVELSGKIYQGMEYIKPAVHEKQVIEALSHACVTMAHDVDARLIATITHSGSTARRIAKYRPKVPIVAFTESNAVLHQLKLVWGVIPIRLEALFDTDKSVRLMKDYLKEHQLATAGERIVLATGIPVAKRGKTNMVTIATID